jgi:hypothetical protein
MGKNNAVEGFLPFPFGQVGLGERCPESKKPGALSPAEKQKAWSGELQAALGGPDGGGAIFK